MTQDRLKDLLDYNPETGEFRWRMNRGGTKAGDFAGSARPNGYRQIRISGVDYLASRLAWMYVNGVFPPEDIDHVNRDRSDNRICNLRPATRSRNLANTVTRNSFGLKGVRRSGSKYIAQIANDGRKTYLGTYPTAELAHAAYCVAARQFHGEFANTNCKKAA